MDLLLAADKANEASIIQHVDTALLIGCYMAIISHMIWSFKAMQKLRDMLFMHESQAEVHVKSNDLVFRDVCDEKVKNFSDAIKDVKQDVKDVKQDVKEVKRSIDQGFNDMRGLIQDKK